MQLDGNADAVEFCPNAAHQDLLAAATYNLVEATAQCDEKRLGSVSLFQADADLKLLDRVRTTGVFDIKWRPANQGDDPLLVQAGADGFLKLYNLIDASDNVTSLQKDKCSLLNDLAGLQTTTSMCLSVEWDPFGTCSQQEMIVSQSDGSISVVQSSRGGLELERSWEAHCFEVWNASYDSWIQRLVYSGADDSHFCGWDLRATSDSPVFRDTKSHEMGVCCIQSNPLRENVVATGSYDENLRLWDVRMMQKPFLKLKTGLRGGVWKVKWHPVDKAMLLAACMHNGFAIVRVDQEKVEVLKEYKEHQSLAYGADWSKGNAPRVATCSFYDKALHIWTP